MPDTPPVPSNMPSPAPVPPASPPPPKRGLLKWLLLGCLIFIGLLILGVGGCGLFLYHHIRTLSEEVAPAAREYVAAQAEITADLGEGVSVVPHTLGTLVSPHQGRARLRCTLHGPKGDLEATVWLEHLDGGWKAVGCEATLLSGTQFKSGKEVDLDSDLDWDD